MSLLVELLAAERRRDLEREAAHVQRASLLKTVPSQSDPVHYWLLVLRRYRTAISH